jgi:hypothetical protein
MSSAGQAAGIADLAAGHVGAVLGQLKARPGAGSDQAWLTGVSASTSRQAALPRATLMQKSRG